MTATAQGIVLFLLICFAVFDLAAFSVAPKILEALKVAETYMEKTENFSGKVMHKCFIIKENILGFCSLSAIFTNFAVFKSRATSFKRVRGNQA